MTKRLVMLLTAIGLFACRKSFGPEEACQRIEAASSSRDGGDGGDAGWLDEERERCRTDWNSLPRDARVCATKCLEKEAHRFDDCADDCGATQTYPVVLCTQLAPDGGSPDDACIVRLSEARTKRPRAYGCVATCVKHAAGPHEAAKCETACGL